MFQVVCISVMCALGVIHPLRDSPVEHSQLRLLGVLVATFAPLITVLVQWLMPTLADRRRIHPPGLGLTSTWMTRNLGFGSWLALMAFVILILDWPNLVRQNWGLYRYILVDELLILAPIIGSLILVWMTVLSRQDRSTRTSRRSLLPMGQLFMYAWEQLRIYLPFSVLPVLVMAVSYDLAQVVQSNTPEPSPVWPFLTAGLVLLSCGYPFMLVGVWRLRPLPNGDLHEKIERFLTAHKVPIRKTLVWHTGQSVVNAMVVGFVPGLRYLILTDKVLCQLGTDDILAAVAHEAAHVRRHHLLIRLGALLLPICLFGAWIQPFTNQWPVGSSEAIDYLAMSTSSLHILPIFLTVLYFATVFGWIARLLELDADLWACRLLASSGDRLAGQAQYTEMLYSLSAGHSFDRRTWLHPSLLARCDFLRRTMDAKTVREAFLLKIRLTTILIVVLLLSPLWRMAAISLLQYFPI